MDYSVSRHKVKRLYRHFGVVAANDSGLESFVDLSEEEEFEPLDGRYSYKMLCNMSVSSY